MYPNRKRCGRRQASRMQQKQKVIAQQTNKNARTKWREHAISAYKETRPQRPRFLNPHNSIVYFSTSMTAVPPAASKEIPSADCLV